jgi:hypothetical protein
LKNASQRPSFNQILIQLNQLLNISVDLELIAQTKEKYSIHEYLNKNHNVDINTNDSLGRTLVNQLRKKKIFQKKN